MTPRCVSEHNEIKEVVRSSGKTGLDKHVTIMMEYDFYAEDGSKVTVGPIPAEGLDSGDKATNKALSAALKYALIQTFSVPTEDMAEADLETPEINKSVSVRTEQSKVASTTTTNARTSVTIDAKEVSNMKNIEKEKSHIVEVKDKTNDLDTALASKEPIKVQTVVPKNETKPARKFTRSQPATTAQSSGDLF
jgi:hypothetical protein